MNNVTLRVDIDGTIAEPKFFDNDFQKCVEMYVQAGIVAPSEVTTFTHHQQVFLLPHVLLTHLPVAGAVETLQALAATGIAIEYFTVRQNFDQEICRQVHAQTKAWLQEQGLPYPTAVSFFWDSTQKLIQSLKAAEKEIYLVDDRAADLVKAFAEMLVKDPAQAQQIQDRVTLVAFGPRLLPQETGGLRIIPLSHWSHFQDIFHKKEMKE